MADITVTGSADFSKVTAGIRKLGADSEAMSKKSRNGGMAVLEISRGLEDLQYGVKGVVNNIPSMVMALGAGAGLAGAASLAVVGVSQLVGWVDKLLDKAQEAKEAKLGQALFDSSGLQRGSKEVMDSVNQQLDLGLKRVRDFQEQVSKGDTIRGTNQSIRDSKASVAQAQRELDLMKAGATEQEIQLANIKAEVLALDEKERSQKESLNAQKMANAGLDESIAKQKAIIENYERMQNAFERGFSAAVGGGAKKFVSDVGEKTGRTSYIPKSIEQANAEREKNIKDAAAKFNSTYDFAALKRAEVAAEIAKKDLENLRGTADASSKALFNAEQANKSKMAELEASRKILEIEKEKAELMQPKTNPTFSILGINEGTIRAFKEAFAKQDEARAAKLEDFKISGDGLLSSQGRIGGSGRELQSAVATINYQRETLNELRKIARNTTNRVVSYG